MINIILTYCAIWRTLTDITAHVSGSKDPGTVVGRLLRAGRLERREIRKRGGGTRFEYRTVIT
jgi:hypothetical protein